MPFSVTVNMIMPKHKFSDKPWKKAVQDELKKTGKDLKGLFDKTVYGWSNKPRFVASYLNLNNSYFVTVTPEGEYAEQWNLVSSGSGPHIIKPKQAPILSFRPGYRSATRPGTLMSRRAYRSGKAVFSKKVNHPGFEARNFPEMIREEYEDKFVDNIQDAINEVARK